MSYEDIKRRSEKRRQIITSHRATDYEEAEKWDLEFWQKLSPEDRLSALPAILEDIKKVEDGKQKHSRQAL